MGTRATGESREGQRGSSGAGVSGRAGGQGKPSGRQDGNQVLREGSVSHVVSEQGHSQQRNSQCKSPEARLASPRTSRGQSMEWKPH